MKKIMLGLVLVIALVGFYGCTKKNNAYNPIKIDKNNILAGSYTPWLPVETTYKSYTGSPNIDSIEFADIMSKKEKENCSFYIEKNPELSYEELKTLADENNDPFAMYDIYARYLKYGDKGDTDKLLEAYDYIIKASEQGHLDAIIFSSFLKYEGQTPTQEYIKKTIEELEKVKKISPLAQHVIYTWELFRMVDYGIPEDYEPLLELKNAGTMYALQQNALIKQSELGLPIDKDLFCEVYFNGCIVGLQEIKKENNIQCQR